MPCERSSKPLIMENKMNIVHVQILIWAILTTIDKVGIWQLLTHLAGKEVACDTRGPGFESCHQQLY